MFYNVGNLISGPGQKNVNKVQKPFLKKKIPTNVCVLMLATLAQFGHAETMFPQNLWTALRKKNAMENSKGPGHRGLDKPTGLYMG